MSDEIPFSTAEEKYRQLAAEARILSVTETDPYKKRQLLLAAQHYDVMGRRARRAVAGRRKCKSA